MTGVLWSKKCVVSMTIGVSITIVQATDTCPAIACVTKYSNMECCAFQVCIVAAFILTYSNMESNAP
jgi:hypothetical protein